MEKRRDPTEEKGSFTPRRLSLSIEHLFFRGHPIIPLLSHWTRLGHMTLLNSMMEEERDHHRPTKMYASPSWSRRKEDRDKVTFPKKVAPGK